MAASDPTGAIGSAPAAVEPGERPRYRAVRLGDLTPLVDRRAGDVVLRARQQLAGYPERFTERLLHWAAVAPERTLLSWRDERGQRDHLSYAAAADAMRRLGQALLDRGLSASRPLGILSGNDREHLLLALAAQHVGVPYAPISPAYSLVSRDFAMLRCAIDLLSPGAVYVSDRASFAPALRAAVAADVEIVSGHTSDAAMSSTFERWLSTNPSGAVDRAHAAIGPDTVAKILFTSGSTGLPKGVINTHRMLCSNQQMILQTLPFLADEPPVLVDWLPWHHTFGGNHNIGIVIYNGGSLYLDRGRPLPGSFEESVRNLREIAPTVYFNVPRGYEELVRALRADRGLAQHFFSRVAAAVLRGRQPGAARRRRARRASPKRRAASVCCWSPGSGRRRRRRWRSAGRGSAPRRRRDRPARARSRREARAGRRDSGGPRPRAERDPGLLATGRAHARRLRRRGVLPDGRCGAVRRYARSRAGARVRRADRRGLQAGERHVGARRAAARRASSRTSRRSCATRSSPATAATSSGCSGFPIWPRAGRSVPTCRDTASALDVLRHPGGPAPRRQAARRARPGCGGQRHAYRARAAPRRAAVARRQRDDRQGLAEPARDPCSSRRPRRRAL